MAQIVRSGTLGVAPGMNLYINQDGWRIEVVSSSRHFNVQFELGVKDVIVLFCAFHPVFVFFKSYKNYNDTKNLIYSIKHSDSFNRKCGHTARQLLQTAGHLTPQLSYWLTYLTMPF